MTEPTQAMVERAAFWIGQLHAPEATDAERAACARWRSEHPAHEVAWQRMCALWDGFGDSAGLPRAATRAAIDAGTVAAAHARRRLRQRAVAVWSAGTVLVLLALTAPMQQPVAYWLADIRSGAGERRVVQLPDDSRITLDSGSAADVRYGADARRIVLRQGAVLVDVARDPARPFLVETPQGTARALGTRYIVSREADSTLVAVLESQVEVCASSGVDCRQLRPGQQLRLDAKGLGTVETRDAADSDAWTQNQWAVENRPVAEVLAVLERHRPGRIRFDAQALEGLRVSGVFPLDDTDRALDVLAATLPLRVARYTPWWVVVQRKQ